jgi:hypothetical protein
MVMRRFATLAGVLAVSLLVVACGLLPRGPTPGTATTYGRSAVQNAGWFGMIGGEPGDAASVGTEGVVCLGGPPGAQIAFYEGEIGGGQAPSAIIGTIPPDRRPLIIWVDIDANGQLTLGEGLPAWWVGDPEFC